MYDEGFLYTIHLSLPSADLTNDAAVAIHSSILATPSSMATGSTHQATADSVFLGELTLTPSSNQPANQPVYL